jgi:hypothetical protein
LSCEDLPETELEDLIGCTGYTGPAKTLEEMDKGIAIGSREQKELSEAMEEIRRGEYIDGDDLLNELRARSRD